jgi:hypothetical protein
MAKRTGFSRSHLANVERGVRQATPAVIKAYERALGDDVKRRDLLLGAAALALPAGSPDIAVDVVRDISAERSRLLSTVQTDHYTDRVIGSLVARDAPCVGSLTKWMRSGSPVLRVNSAGILAKVGSSTLDNEVVTSLRSDHESRDLYLQAVVSRVLGVPWDEAGRLVAVPEPMDYAQVKSFAEEARNSNDSGARWCSVVMLAGLRPDHRNTVDAALSVALRQETSRENLRAIAGTLAGLNPLTV